MTSGIAATPEPPYVAVIFTNLRTNVDDGYEETAAEMEALAAQQPGYLGHEGARDGVGITVSYWTDEAAALGWKAVVEHMTAQQRGRQDWYTDYTTRIATVHRAYTKATSTFPR
ncbi:antibiotic biosynthesis monooxygenase [Nocardioides sp. BP30]|uniref:antibiotic biosynthesis monooxygenase family protein n=1 Tax=Nocardioides sp. BP30 TaxID=3036374 RepID=UPI002468DDE2|nr:antibiotic biosynthesis monooxygenase [Nocardioides sp. BP30]WGL52150.1 antibiotic biosynthesis monooxygenase [Nocardioides sp. BP30]